MANFITRATATGNSKTYYKVEDEFVATGTFFSDSGMYYVAAHPSLGLWICAQTGDNTPIPIGFVRWGNIERFVVDEEHSSVFVVLKNYDEVINNADFTFRKIYKGPFTHVMQDTQEKSIKLPLSLFSGGILPYLQQRYTITAEKVKGVSNFWSYVSIFLYIFIFAMILLSIFS